VTSLGTQLLNGAAKQAATKAGFEYVPPEPKFAGHEACSGDPYFWGLTMTNRTPVPSPSNFSFHPNYQGHQVFEDAVWEQLQKIVISGTILVDPCPPDSYICPADDIWVRGPDGNALAELGDPYSAQDGVLGFAVTVPDLPYYLFAVAGGGGPNFDEEHGYTVLLKVSREELAAEGNSVMIDLMCQTTMAPGCEH
jgi:hypothetical protein